MSKPVVVVALATAAGLAMLVGGCQLEGDPYYSEAASTSERASAESEILAEDMVADMEDCARSILSYAACDRAISKLDEFRQVVDRARGELMLLEPPAEARGWHEDALSLYADFSTTINTMVNAYYAGDMDTFVSEIGEWESLAEEEGELVRRFRDLQE